MTSILFANDELRKLWLEGEKRLREKERIEESERQARLREARAKTRSDFVRFGDELVSNGMPAAFLRYSELDDRLSGQLASENPVGPEPYRYSFTVESEGIAPIRVNALSKNVGWSESGEEQREWTVENYRVASAHLETKSVSEALAVAWRAWHEQKKEALEDDAEVDA